MSAESDKIRDTFANQLASFEDRLEAKADDVEMLADIQDGIAGLLASDGNSEAEIRRILQERYDAGDLRNETFQLVKSMLDRFVTEQIPTSPVAGPTGMTRPADAPTEMKSPSILDEFEPPEESPGDDQFGSTTVIPKDSLPDATPEANVQVGSLLRDRFLLQERVSGGSMGVVFKALDRRLAEAESDEPWVAIKVLSPILAKNAQALRALQQEASKGRCLAHPNIVRFVDLDRDDELYFLIMEWLEGRTLADILDSTDAGSIDHDAAFRIVRQIGDALDYAHRCGIVHADVKPGNIMIMPNGDAKLFDFGVARVRQKQNEAEFDPGVLGAMTPAYSSMQVLTGEEPVAADDVFALGCLLYRLLAGYRVFGPRNAAEASQEGMKPQQPQGVNEDHWRALKRALSYARVTRYQTVQEFIDALEAGGEDTLNLDQPHSFEKREDGSYAKWIFAAVVVLGLALRGAYEYGYLDPWLNISPTAQESGDTGIQDDPAIPNAGSPDSVVTDNPLAAEERVEELDTVVVSVEPKPEFVPLIDFSTLPPPTAEVTFRMGENSGQPVRVTLREDGAPAIVDFVRSGDTGVPLTLKLDEIRFSGNRSPWGSGQYTFSNEGILEFPVGQDRARLTLTMASDPLREADQSSTLRLREVDSAASELALLSISLEDDDQRTFEAQLPVNTIAFAAGQASIRETDPAVQIDLVRFNPDSTSLEVGFSVFDVTATEGEDYFAPGSYTIAFGPGQRSARLLIPLVQDSAVEGDEAFVVQLEDTGNSGAIDVYQRIAVMIRDDESQTR